MKRTVEIKLRVVYDDQDGTINPIKMVKMDMECANWRQGFLCSESIDVSEPRELPSASTRRRVILGG